MNINENVLVVRPGFAGKIGRESGQGERIYGALLRRSPLTVSNAVRAVAGLKLKLHKAATPRSCAISWLRTFRRRKIASFKK